MIDAADISTRDMQRALCLLLSRQPLDVLGRELLSCDWSGVEKLAVKEGVAPLLYWNLEELLPGGEIPSSLVEPRPEDPEIVSTWSTEIHDEVLSIRPGITSPASVMYHNEEVLLPASNIVDTYLEAILPSKLWLDQLYTRHRSFLLDLDVLLWTSMVIIPRVGAATPIEERLFLGPLSRLVRRHVSWFMIDLLVTFIAISITGLFWRSFGPLDVGVTKSLGIAFGFALLYSLVAAGMGVNRTVWSRASLTDAIDLLPAVLLSTVIALLLNIFWSVQPLLPPALIVLASVLATTGFILVRYRSRLMRAMALRWMRMRNSAIDAYERVLILGGGETGQFMAWWLQDSTSAGMFRVVGFVDDDLFKQNTRLHGVEVIGKREDIPTLVSRHDIGIIIFAIHNIPEEERERLLAICSLTPARTLFVPDVLGDLREFVNAGSGRKDGYVASTDGRDIQNGNFIPSEQVVSWLSELEEISSHGDTINLHSKIKAIKKIIASQ